MRVSLEDQDRKVFFNPEGYLEGFTIGGSHLILPWGIETSDPTGFFSSSEPSRRMKIQKEVEILNNTMNSRFVASSKNGAFEISSRESLQQEDFLRLQSLETLKPTYLADFVMRFQFKKEHFDCAHINRIDIPHTNSNINYQYQTTEVYLTGPQLQVNLKVVNWDGLSKFKMCCYVKDIRDAWVVHFRMLPIEVDKLILKICKSWAGDRALPEFLGNVFTKNSAFNKKFWYGSENVTPRGLRMLLNPGVFPYTMLETGEKIHIKVNLNYCYRN